MKQVRIFRNASPGNNMAAAWQQAGILSSRQKGVTDTCN